MEDLEHVLTHTRPLWEQLRGGRIFVTGATGFFGTWLLESFVHANEQLGLGAELVGLTRNPDAFLAKAPHLADHGSIRLHKGDVRDFEFPTGNFSHVIHAGNPSSTPVPPAEMLETIIKGTRHTLDFALASGARRFLFVSSGAVYGKQPPEMTHIPETYNGAPDPIDPNSAYGEGKRVGELLCAMAHQEHGLETIIARCFAFVGPHIPLNLASAIGNFIGDAINGCNINVKGDGQDVRSYLYASDLVIWLWKIFFIGNPTSVYNVGSKDPISIKSLAVKIAQNINPVSKVVIQGENKTISLPNKYIPSCERAHNELFLDSWVGIDEAIYKTANWYKKNESF